MMALSLAYSAQAFTGTALIIARPLFRSNALPGVLRTFKLLLTGMLHGAPSSGLLMFNRMPREYDVAWQQPAVIRSSV